MTPRGASKSPVTLLLVDVVNDLSFEGGEELVGPAMIAARNVAKLASRARRAGVPVIYANDNFGQWRSDFRSMVARCLEGGRGEPLVRLLAPHDGDYFVLKPKMSAFFATPLRLLLTRLGTKRLIVCGFAADACVYATAHDAHAYELDVVVPRDGIAAETKARKSWALRQMRDLLSVSTPTCAEIPLRGRRSRA